MTKKELLIILIITFLVIMFWVTSDIIHTKSSVGISPSLQSSLDSVNPNFDQTTLDKVAQINPVLPIIATPVPTPVPTPIPTPTPQPASPSANPVSTESATLNQ